MRAKPWRLNKQIMTPATARDLQALPQGSRVLLAVTDRIGDSLFRTPLIRLLSSVYAGLRFEGLAFGPGAFEVLSQHPGLSRVHLASEKQEIKHLAEGFDLVINTRSSNVRRYLCQVDRPIIQHSRPAGTEHKTEDLLQFGRTLLPEPAELSLQDRRYVLPLPDGLDERVRQRVRLETGLSSDDQVFIGLHLGCASLERYKLVFATQHLVAHKKVWPADRFADLADQLSRSSGQRTILILGSKSESYLGRRLAQRVPQAINLCGELTLMEMTALMDSLRLFIGNDSGPMHLACAREIPVLGLFGPTNPKRTGPFPGLPQFRSVTASSMDKIQVEDVRLEAESLLEHSGWLPAFHSVFLSQTQRFQQTYCNAP